MIEMLEGRERQSSAYRSVRYSTIRKASFTADMNRQSLTRVKKKPLLESTFYNTRTLQLKPQKNLQSNNPEQLSYIESFNTLLNSEKRAKEEDDQQFKQCEINIKFLHFDHHFLKEDQTQFTLLDPFHRPYSYLTRELTKAEKQLKAQKQDLRLIKAQLGVLKHSILTDLMNSEQQGKNQFLRLRNMFKKNETAQQQRKMRVRRQVTYLYEQHDNNKKTGEQVLLRIKGMQRDIFNCEPFELERIEHSVSQ